MWKYPTFKESHKRSLTRSVIWRVLGIGVLALITYIYTQSWIITTLVTVVHHTTFILVYYLHERFWLRVKWFRNSRRKPIARLITYEIILGNVILGAVSFVFTGDLQQMTLITLTYIGNKCWMFIAYDYIWSKVKWQTRRILIYTYVVGDLLHVGHLRVLQQAKALGDYLIVGVLTDEATAVYKRKPIIPFEERIELIRNLKCVDEAMVQHNVDPTDNLKTLDVDIVTHGDDWDEDFPGSAYMLSIGKRAMRVKWCAGRPTTQQIAYLQGYIKRLEEEGREE